MSDIAPEFDFAASLVQDAQATQQPSDSPEPAPVEGTPGPEPVSQETAPEGRPRDEQGRFVSQEQPVEQVEPAAQPFTSDPDLQQYLAKYGGDVEKALRGALEQQSLFGRQANELGELRQQLSQFQEQFQETQQRQQTDWDSLLENPAQAVQVAFQQGNAPMLQQAFAQWADEDPAAAWSWRSDRMIEVQRQQILQEVEQRIGPVVQQTSEQQFAQAMAGLARQYPDLEQMAPAMAQIAQERPHVLDGLQSQNPQVRATVLEDLYHLARSRSAPQIAAAIQQAQAAQAAEAERAKQDAFVASGSMSAAPQGEQQLTPGDILAQGVLGRASQALIDEGWNTPPPGWRQQAG